MTGHFYTICLNRLKLRAKLGVFDWEREEFREFLTDVEVVVSTTDKVAQDDLQATVDYAQLESLLLTYAAAQEWQLIERLLASLASAVLEQFSMIESIQLRLHKPQALEKSDVAVKYIQSRGLT